VFCSFCQTCKIFADCTIRTVLTWQMTVQVVRPYSDVAEEWHADWAGVEDVVESLFDKCHLVDECNGATWHPSVGW
jgi:hypothetical protein